VLSSPSFHVMEEFYLYGRIKQRLNPGLYLTIVHDLWWQPWFTVQWPPLLYFGGRRPILEAPPPPPPPWKQKKHDEESERHCEMLGWLLFQFYPIALTRIVTSLLMTILRREKTIDIAKHTLALSRSKCLIQQCKSIILD